MEKDTADKARLTCGPSTHKGAPPPGVVFHSKLEVGEAAVMQAVTMIKMMKTMNRIE